MYLIAPIVTVIPEVATFLPGQDEIVLRCMPNSSILTVQWLSGDSVLSVGNVYRATLPAQSAEYNCSVQEPVTNNTVFSALIPLRNVPGIILMIMIIMILKCTLVVERLSVRRNGISIENNTFIEIANRRSDPLDLQCLEHVESSYTNLTWIVLSDSRPESFIPLSTGKAADSNYSTSVSGNQANLLIINSFEAFSGLVKCVSSSGLFVNIRVVGGINSWILAACSDTLHFVYIDSDAAQRGSTCEEERDPVWNIFWNNTISSSVDFQPCAADATGTD